MRSHIVGIAGGTGAGKTTLANLLAEREPERYTVVRLDDYYKQAHEMNPVDGILNWERPEALKFGRLAEDLRSLQEGYTLHIETRVWKYDAAHQKVGEENFSYEVVPKPVILVEGFLALYDEHVRSLMDVKIYLDIPIEESLTRRLKMDNKYNKEQYFRDILIPAHREFVEPTKAYADIVLPVSDKTTEEVYAEARARIEELI